LSSLEYNLDKYLRKDEKILWVGKPEVRKIFDPKDVWFIPITILFFTSILYKTWFEPDTLVVDSVLMLFGLYLLIGRFIYKALNKKKNCLCRDRSKDYNNK